MHRQDKYKIAKSYLNQYKTFKIKIENNHYKMLELDRKINEPQTTSVVEMKMGSNETRSKNENTIDKYVLLLEDLYIKYKKDIDKLKSKEIEIDNFIRDNTNTESEYLALYLYYIDGFNLENIAVKIGYSYSHTVKLYVNGLRSIQKALKEKGE